MNAPKVCPNCLLVHARRGGNCLERMQEEIAALRALLAAQEARAQRVEQAARALVERDGDPYPGHVRGCSCMDCEAVSVGLRFALEAALSQPADERGECDPECVHCASWRAK
jgi:hypothetical protein